MDVTLEEAKQALGQKALTMTDEQILNIVAMYQNLAEGWLDNHERTIFKGKTINELLTVKNGGRL